jgi:hypothetical protein
MRYPTANLGALGRATLFPAGAAVRPSAPPRLTGRVLGITASTEASAARLRQAQDVLGRVQRTYPRLVASIGESGARGVFDQANEGVALAQQEYQDAQGASGGAR